MIGATLDGRYRIVRCLGAGGMGVVYEAEHLQLSRRFAIKCMQARPGGVSEQEAARFRREARTVSAIKDPHVVEVTDMGMLADGRAYLVLELLEGEDLAATLERESRLPIARAIEIGCQVLKGLEAVHQSGIIHRDLKPANVFLTREHGSDFVRIFDFGISKMIGGSSAGHDPRAAETITGTGQAIGTPLYMAPEQLLRPDDVDTRADIYAAGVLLYEMLAGQRPFEGVPYASLLQQICSANRPSLRALRPDVSPALERLVLRAMSFDRDMRPATCSEFAAGLRHTSYIDESAIEHASTLVGTSQTMPRLRSRNRNRAGALFALAIVAVVGWALFARAPSTVQPRAEARLGNPTSSPPPLPASPIPAQRMQDAGHLTVEHAAETPVLRSVTAGAPHTSVPKRAARAHLTAAPGKPAQEPVEVAQPAPAPTVKADPPEGSTGPAPTRTPEASPTTAPRRGLLPVAL